MIVLSRCSLWHATCAPTFCGRRIEHPDLSGDTRSAKVRELIDNLERRMQL